MQEARRLDPELRSLHLAGGSAPSRAPPSGAAIAATRGRFARALGVDAETAEQSHAAAPWKHMLFRAVLEQWSDPDAALPEWLAAGAPMGLTKAIALGGHLPQQTVLPALRVTELEPMWDEDINHPSLRKTFGDDSGAAGVALVQKSVDDGFGEIFADRAAAEAALGGRSSRRLWVR